MTLGLRQYNEQLKGITKTKIKYVPASNISVLKHTILGEYMMNILEAIEVRRSCRTFINEPIPTTEFNDLKKLVDQYNQRSGLSMALLEDGSDAFNGLRKSYGMFKGVKSLLVIKGKQSDMHRAEKAGYYGELIVLEATILGLGSCWVGGTYDKKNSILNVLPDEVLEAVIPIGYPADSPTLTEKVIHKLIHRRVKPLEHFYKSDVSLPEWFIRGIEAVRKAPSAVNKQPVRFSLENGITTAYVELDDGFKLIDLGVAKLHFELATDRKFETGNYGILNVEVEE